jgi:hypothetical protein
MAPGTICNFRLRAQNNIGYSPYSDPLTVYFAQVPNAPAAPTLVQRSGGDSTIGLKAFI